MRCGHVRPLLERDQNSRSEEMPLAVANADAKLGPIAVLIRPFDQARTTPLSVAVFAEYISPGIAVTGIGITQSAEAG